MASLFGPQSEHSRRTVGGVLVVASVLIWCQLACFVSLTDGRLASPCPHATQINTNGQFRGTLHFICLQTRPNSWPTLDVIQYNTNQVIFSQPIQEADSSQLASFVDEHDGSLRVIVSVPNRLNGTSVYSINSLGQYIDERHTINTQLVSALNVWRLELTMRWQLAIANGRTHGPYVSEVANTNYSDFAPAPPPPVVTIHSWRSSYFDQYQQIELEQQARVNKLEPMHINGQEFLMIAAGPPDGPRQHLEGAVQGANSLIYRLDFGDGQLNWAHYQTLETRLVLDASSFAVTHRASLQRDYFIALLGRPAQAPDHDHDDPSLELPAEAAKRTKFGLLIYKYFGDRFILQRSIETPGMAKLDTISYGSGDSYVIIALASPDSRSILLYSFNGLDLRALPGPQRQAPGSPQRLVRRGQEPPGALRLFISPPPVQAPREQTNSTNSKRTLGAEAVESVPSLAFSVPAETLQDEGAGPSSAPSENATETTQAALFQIATSEAAPNAREDAWLVDREPAELNATQKRQFIPTNRAQSAASELFNWCRATLERILGDNFESLARQLQELPRIDQSPPIEINGNLLVEGNLHVSSLLYAAHVGSRALETPAGFVEQVIQEPVPVGADLREALETFETSMREVDSLVHQADQLLVDDGSLQVVHAPLNFERLKIDCRKVPSTSVGLSRNAVRLANPQQGATVLRSLCPQVGAIRSVWLNGRDVSDIQQQAPRSGRAMSITRDVRFEHLVLVGRSQILDTLNGIPIDEIVFGRGLDLARPISGHKQLHEALYASSHLQVEAWNMQRVSRQTVLTAAGQQEIMADLRLAQVVIDTPASPMANYSSRVEVLNGRHLDTHLAQMAQSDRDNLFELPLRFDALVLNGPIQFGPQALLSQVDLNDLWRNAMLKSAHQNVTAPMEFAGQVHLATGAGLQVDGLVNGLHLSRESVMMRNRNYELSNPMVFHGDLSLDTNLVVMNRLNNVGLIRNAESGQNELALLYDGGAQTIWSEKILNDVRLAGRSNVNGLINGNLNLTQLHSLTYNQKPFRFPHYRLRPTNHSNPVVRFAEGVPLHVVSTIDGIPVQTLCSLANYSVRAPVKEYRRLRFEQPIRFSRLTCGSINGFNNLSSSFMTRHGHQRVLGSLRLTNGVLFNSSTQIGMKFNNLNVAPLASAISRAINESRTGHKEIFGDFVVDELTVDGQINNLRMADVFLARADHPQVIRAPMQFEHLDVENVLVVGGDLSTSSFNGLNMSELLSNTLQYDAPQIIYNHLVLDNLHLLSGSNLVTKSLNGHDLRRLFSDSVLVDSAQQILAPKTFVSPVRLNERVSLRYGIDGLSEEELRFNLLVQGDEQIEDDAEFNNDVTVFKSLEIQTGSINDIDVGQFVQQLNYERADRAGLRLVGNSSIRFREVQLKNLSLTGRIAGIDVSREALLRNATDARQQQEAMARRPAAQPPVIVIPNPFEPPPTANNRGAHAGAAGSNVRAPLAHPTPLAPPATHYRPPPPHVIHYQPADRVPLQPLMPRPLSYINQSAITNTWQPIWNAPAQAPKPAQPSALDQSRPSSPADDLLYDYNFVKMVHPQGQPFALASRAYWEHQARLRAQALDELSTRINKYLAVSFYYEIAQKHPLLGPLLGDATNPKSGPAANPLLLLKGVGRPGELCLQRGQTVAVMAPMGSRKSQYTLSSQLSDASQPILVQSLAVGGAGQQAQRNYLFIVDLHPPHQKLDEHRSQVFVYVWDSRTGRYDLREQIPFAGYPSGLKAFAVPVARNHSLACFALANPRALQRSGAPLVRCQATPAGEFSQEHVLGPMANIIDLDVVSPPDRWMQFVVAALSQQDSEQIGDLLVYSYDLVTRRLQPIDRRRMVKPLKLHFVKLTPVQAAAPSSYQLLVSEAITSNDAAQALTRVYALRLAQNTIASPRDQLFEIQVIKDNQFTDIQSALLDRARALLFMKSANSISIYAPTSSYGGFEPSTCLPELVLVQKIPTKGANKFLVFNSNNNDALEARERNSSGLAGGSAGRPFGHLLVLSQDDCEHQHYSTTILKAKFQ